MIVFNGSDRSELCVKTHKRSIGLLMYLCDYFKSDIVYCAHETKTGLIRVKAKCGRVVVDIVVKKFGRVILLL